MKKYFLKWIKAKLGQKRVEVEGFIWPSYSFNLESSPAPINASLSILLFFVFKYLFYSTWISILYHFAIIESWVINWCYKPMLRKVKITCGDIDESISFSLVLLSEIWCNFNIKINWFCQVHRLLLIWSILYRLSFLDKLQIED